MEILTPVDITNKEFRRSIRGYNEYEVDSFLDQVARDYETLYRRQAELEELLQQKESQLQHYRATEEMLSQALVLAQNTAEEVKRAARQEAELIVREARQEAEEIIQQAMRRKEVLEQEWNDLCQTFISFKAQIKSFLKAQMEIVESFTLGAAGGKEAKGGEGETGAKGEPGRTVAGEEKVYEA